MITTTLVLQQVAGIRSHADASRVIISTLDDLVKFGAAKRVGKAWELNGKVIARESEYIDSMQRPRSMITFGSILSLAAALKATNPKLRACLMEAAGNLSDLEEMK